MTTHCDRRQGGKPGLHETPAVSVDAQAAEVERVLCDLMAQFQRLTSLAHERREAMRSADPSRLARCISCENEAVQQVAEIEKRRITIIGRIAERLGVPGKTQTRVTSIAERIGGPIGDRLKKQAQELLRQIETLRRANEIARDAAASLSAHMEGLLRQASQTLNHSKTYGRLGSVEPGPAVVSGLDVRT